MLQSRGNPLDLVRYLLGTLVVALSLELLDLGLLGGGGGILQGQ